MSEPSGPSLAALAAITLMHIVVGCTLVAITQAWIGETAALAVAAAAFLTWLLHIGMAGTKDPR